MKKSFVAVGAALFLVTILFVVWFSRAGNCDTPGNPAPVASSAEQVSLTPDQTKTLAESLNACAGSYAWKGTFYLFAYYFFALGGTLASGGAGLLLQLETIEKSNKKPAMVLGFLGAALITTMTYVDFNSNARANKAAANQTKRLQFRVEKGELKREVDVREIMQDIFEQKQSLALPKVVGKDGGGEGK